MKILVTGADGFIGKNLCVRLEENNFELIKIDRDSSKHDLELGLINANFIFHLAGVNRPKNEYEFHEGNASLTEEITHFLIKNKKKTPIMLSSSIQANNDNKYGESKKLAENHIEAYGLKTDASYYIYRLPNVFGKWCRPNYNSFIATFCHNIANNIDIIINSPTAKVSLIYIDDLCNELISLLNGNNKVGFQNISPVYETTVGEVADLLYTFKNSRNTLVTEKVGVGFTRALYSTWLSYLNPQQFAYSVPHYGDQRGIFCEMLKTQNSGQFSFFTAHPGITRGGHYHHTKTEKFLVIKGKALFKFENIITGEKYELTVSDNEYKIVETVPGWSHDITNIADNELVVMLWANEIFNKELPDTIARPL
ncbi:NAD-dependent epimerase/dehydratase family protein [Proteus mirabilis]|uniref:UDP-2-acetamido-2,6-beta-L-arabino-hexul-4-ose reductase n=1 Tax=Proteus mirabilis TaxID=584 RepID=UPI000BA140E3|nr:NAD-dependent epimerase/dehydratase family protein [Proteus mirabilis]MDM3746528.1 NAD-dependent epimerase/dehydratase family protein [Proteus mirabilis]OZS66051.1 capsular biosynthesis protein [Proteus mirabilis]HAU5008449.1 SDR family oxidoreductase [Proteus mirabilis]HBC5641401.1 NAD-dependent epimerase/dehydratase family protein [Proteus mirabilis]HBC5643515.1 NAD-dependent epimerase/dehydratase family protein [Proteus mirabilis]